jgi:hypothetical protein
VFFTRDGREYDARVVDIVKNPISPWETVQSPFLHIREFVAKQIEKFNKTREEKLEESISTTSPSSSMRDILLGGSVAIAALGSAFAYITKALSQVKIVHVLGVLLGIMGLVIIPGAIIGFAKTRKRNISVVLEATGFSVNMKLRLNSLLGHFFTRRPSLPQGSNKKRRNVLLKVMKGLGYRSLSSRLVWLFIIVFLLVGGFFIIKYFPELKDFLKNIK